MGDKTTSMYMGPLISYMKLVKPDGTVNGTGWDLMFAYICHPGIVILSYIIMLKWRSVLCNMHII